MRGGKCTIIDDDGREYDTEKIEEHSSYTQGLIRHSIHIRYMGIRDLLLDNCCSKYKVNQVGEVLNKDNNIKRIKDVFGYSTEEINYCINFAEAFISMMR